MLHPCALDTYSLSIGRVNKRISVGPIKNYSFPRRWNTNCTRIKINFIEYNSINLSRNITINTVDKEGSNTLYRKFKNQMIMSYTPSVTYGEINLTAIGFSQCVSLHHSKYKILN